MRYNIRNDLCVFGFFLFSIHPSTTMMSKADIMYFIKNKTHIVSNAYKISYAVNVIMGMLNVIKLLVINTYKFGLITSE